MRLFLLLFFVMYAISGSSLLAMCLVDDPYIALLLIENEQEYRRARAKKIDPVIQLVSTVVGNQDPTDAECILCYKSYDSNKRARIVLPCDPVHKVSHSFCKRCLVDWQTRSSTCPICRRPFALEQPPAQVSLIKLLLGASCFGCQDPE